MNEREHYSASDRCNVEYNSRCQAGTIDRSRLRPDPVDTLGHLTLIWNNTDDLDIHIITPHGKKVYYADPVGSGHFLLLDENACLPYKSKPVEDYYWKKDATSGTYRVIINNYKARNEKFTPFAVHFTPFIEGVAQVPISYDTTDDKGLQDKESVFIGAIAVKDGHATFDVKPNKFKMEQDYVEPTAPITREEPISRTPELSVLFKKEAQQPEGYPVAIRLDKRADPVAEISNGYILDIVEDTGDEWYGVKIQYRGTVCKGYCKKRNTTDIIHSIPVNQNQDLGILPDMLMSQIMTQLSERN